MTKSILFLSLSSLLLGIQSAQAVIVERLPQGLHNTQRPVVNEELAAYTRHVDMTAPRADTSVKHRVYTYDNNMSEYLRDNLNLPKMDSNYAMQSASYLKTVRQRDKHNSTPDSILFDSVKKKYELDKIKNPNKNWLLEDKFSPQERENYE